MNRPSSRRNHALGVANGTLVNLGNAFADPFTVLPVFIAALGGSGVLVGFVSASFTAGWFLPQVLVASFAQTRRRVLPIYAGAAVFRLIGFVGAGVSVFLIGADHPRVVMWSVIAGLTMNALAAGVGGIPFLEITSKTVDVQRRGSFFAGRRVLGGILGVVAGLVIAAVLDGDPGMLWSHTLAYRMVKSAAARLGLTGHPLPYDYGWLIVIGGIITTSGVIAYLFVREPPAEHVSPRVPLHRTLADGAVMLRRMPDYRTYFLMRVFYQLTAMAFPFYSTFAYLRLGFAEASVGFFVSMWVGAGVLANLVWGRLLDSRGNRIVFVATAALSVFPPLAMIVLGAGRVPPGAAVGLAVFSGVAATFLINGSVRAGRFVANNTYLLESAPPERRPLYVGFMNSLSFPFMLSPILGGIVVETLGYTALFGIAAAAALANVVASRRIAEPRHPRAALRDVPTPP